MDPQLKGNETPVFKDSIYTSLTIFLHSQFSIPGNISTRSFCMYNLFLVIDANLYAALWIFASNSLKESESGNVVLFK